MVQQWYPPKSRLVTEAAVEGVSEGMGLNYFGWRYYDPKVAMWISLDPKEQFWSGYSYGFNPINGVDPDGRKHFIIGTMDQLNGSYAEMEKAYGIYIEREDYKQARYNGQIVRRLYSYTPIMFDDEFVEARKQLDYLINSDDNYIITYSYEINHIYGRLTKQGTQWEASMLHLDLKAGKAGSGSYYPQFNLTYIDPKLFNGPVQKYKSTTAFAYKTGGFESFIRGALFKDKRFNVDYTPYEIWDVILHESMHSYEVMQGLAPKNPTSGERKGVEAGVQGFVNSIRMIYGKWPRI